jgi:hypothetical protein
MRYMSGVLLWVVLSCAAGQAQQNPAVGKWDCTSDDGHGAVVRWMLTVDSDQGKLAGTIVQSDLAMPLIDPRLEGAVFRFKTFVNPNCTISFQVTIKENSLEGTFSCPEVSGTLKGFRQPSPS